MYVYGANGVTERDSVPDEDLVVWLKEAGRRTVSLPSRRSHENDETWSRTPAHLFRLLEESAGRKLRSQTEVLSYLRELSGDSPQTHRARERRRVIREGVLLGALALAWLQYYFWEVHTQIASLPCVQVFGVVPSSKSRVHISYNKFQVGVRLS